MKLQLLNAATATNSPPSGASAGVALYQKDGSATGISSEIDEALFLLKSTAGSDTMTVTVRLWGYSAVSAAWHPLGTGTASGKGVLNGGSAIAETGTDEISHAEAVSGLRHLDRLYAEITAIGGTSTAVSAWLVAKE